MKSTFCVHHYFLVFLGGKGLFHRFGSADSKRLSTSTEEFFLFCCSRKKEKQPMKKYKPNQQFMGLLLMLRARRSLQGNRRGARRQHKNGAKNTEISRKATAKYQSFTWEPDDDLMRMRCAEKSGQQSADTLSCSLLKWQVIELEGSDACKCPHSDHPQFRRTWNASILAE
jgi:hypothetical protein